MEVSDKFQITIKLGGQNFSITILREDELFYRNAEKLINERFTYYVNHFPQQDKNTYMLMTVLDIAVRMQKIEAHGNLSPVMPRLQKLVEEINVAL